MKQKLLIMSPLLLFLSGCEVLDSLKINDTHSRTKKNVEICVWGADEPEKDCKIDYWLHFWADIEKDSWPTRKKRIEELSEGNSDLLKKVILSQGKGTPYQSRLRAQTWLESLLPKLSEEMRQFVMVAIYQPSQELLEMESALVTLSKINTHQSTSLEEQKLVAEEQKLQLEKQQSQIEQLLNIETSIMENVEGENK